MLSCLKFYFKKVQNLLSIDFVADTPKFKFRINEVNNTFTFETASLVPANYTWMSCLSSNDRYAHCQFGSGQSALKCTHAEIQISSQVPALCLIAFVKQTLPGMRSQMLLEQTLMFSVTRQSRTLLAEIWWMDTI